MAAEDVYGNISLPAWETPSTQVPNKVDLPPQRRPYVLINMVSSLDGKVTTGSGKAGDIGGPTDRILMRSLRALSDAVMIGAGTLRAEKLTLAVPEDLAKAREARGLKPQPLAVVMTATGDVPLRKNLLGPSPEDLLVLVSSEIPRERLAVLSGSARVEVAPKETSGPRLDLRKVLETLKGRHAVGTLVVEGGPLLNHSLISLGLADELFLTLAPKLLGGAQPHAITMLEGPEIPPQRVDPELVSVHASGNELFLRYGLRAGGAFANPPEPRKP